MSKEHKSTVDEDPNPGWTWSIAGLQGVVRMLQSASVANQRAYAARADEIELEAQKLLEIVNQLRSNPQ
jgi:hypothetical protein